MAGVGPGNEILYLIISLSNMPYELIYLSPTELVLVALLDLAIGDPNTRWHPVCLIGAIISKTEGFFRKSRLAERPLHGGLFFVIVSLSSLIALGLPLVVLRYLAIGMESLLLNFLFLLILSLFLAFRTLLLVGLKIERLLALRMIDEARRELQALVGRDRDGLLPQQIRKAVVESYAENLNDGVFAPIFWLVLWGWPGLLFYKVVNTLDSMVGYKDERYRILGWFSARMDDLLNYLPARLTGLIISFSSGLLFGLKVGLRSLFAMFRDGSKHESPNSGYPEAAMAGALGVALLGPAYYQGRLTLKPYLGENLVSITPNIIPWSARLIVLSYIFYVLTIFSILKLLS